MGHKTTNSCKSIFASYNYKILNPIDQYISRGKLLVFDGPDSTVGFKSTLALS